MAVFQPSEIVLEAFIDRLGEDYDRAFPLGVPEERQALLQCARMALRRMTFTNALYTNLTMSLLTTQIAADMLRGRFVHDGNVTSDEWIHFLLAALFHCIGFVRGILPGDDGRRCVVNERGDYLDLDPAHTDGVMIQDGVGMVRSALFVRHFFRVHPIVDGQRLGEMVQAARFPRPDNSLITPDSWPGLLRGCQSIAVAADPRFTSRMKFFYMQMHEGGVAEQLGYKHAADVQSTFPVTFWRQLLPQVSHVMAYLKYTADGQTWLARMNAQMLEEEHRDDAPKEP